MAYALYFRCTPEALREKLPGWVEPPTSPTPLDRRNPGTGEVFQTLEYQCERPADGPDSLSDTIERMVPAADRAEHRSEPLGFYRTGVGTRPEPTVWAELRRPFMVGPWPEQELFVVSPTLRGLVRTDPDHWETILGPDLLALMVEEHDDLYVLLEAD